MLLEILLLIAAVLVVLLIFIVTRPGELRVTRSTVMNAPPPVVFANVNNLHRWEAWSPWAKRDPNMKVTYSGPDAGIGAHYAWLGNKEVGQGAMTITDSKLDELVLIRLEFIKPFRATNTTEFRLEPVDGQTRVVWTMWGAQSFVSKAMGLVINMDKMIGGDFEKGLADLKVIVESQPQSA